MSKKTAITEIDQKKVVEPIAEQDPSDLDRLVSGSKTLSEDVVEWLRLKVQLIQIEVHERLKDEVNAILSSIVVLGLLLIAILLFMMAAGFYLGELVEDTGFGFAIVGLGIGILAIILGRIQPQWMGEAMHTLVPRRWLKRKTPPKS